MLQHLHPVGTTPAPAHRSRLSRRLERDHWDVADVARAVRWGATCLAAIGAFASTGVVAGYGLRRYTVGAGVLVLYAVFRTVWPTRAASAPRATLAATSAEVLLCMAVVTWTGGWSSPYILNVGGALIVAGLLGGFRHLLAGMAVVLAGAGAGALDGIAAPQAASIPQRLVELAVMGAVGAYARRVFDAQAGHRGELARLRSADEINSLLLELHARAADQPGALTLRGAVASAVARLRDLLAPDLVVLLLRDPTAEDVERPWQVAVSEGLALPALLPDSDLPPALRQGVASRSPLLRSPLRPGQGLDPEASTGLYVPLWARQTLVGLLAVERRGSSPFVAEDADVLEEVARHAGLAIDNARWFGRLRSLGADEERERIARELHDRVGQALAAVALSADRLAVTLPGEEPGLAGPQLEELAAEVRSVTRQIREKLSDLRTGLGEDSDLAQMLGGFCERVEARSSLRVTFVDGGVPRLPASMAREVWHIAYEAIVNAERHCDGSSVTVRWSVEHGDPVLVVTDDGKGLGRSAPLRRDAYGLLGMRERAGVIGATLVVDSAPGQGTTVRLRLPGAPAPTAAARPGRAHDGTHPLARAVS